MKIPLTPKPFQELLSQESENIQQIIHSATTHHLNKYFHWDDLRHRQPPKGLTSEQWWLGIKLPRLSQQKSLPLLDTYGKPFVFNTPSIVSEMLHEIDSRGAGRIAMPEEVSNPDTKTRFLVRSLIEEAITSSQLEGASTTRQEAMDMFRSGRKPSNKSEQMIFNNLKGMEYTRAHIKDQLTPEMVLQIHSELMQGTIASKELGRLQTPDDDRVHVADSSSSQILHIPPPAKELKQRLRKMCHFANAKGETEFLHPVIRAIILHFWLAYDHPFSDGNGRTARAVFYWSMLNSGYWIFEFISISSILRKASTQYAKSYLYTETDDNDATYFIIHQLRVIQQALQSLEKYLERKATEIRHAEELLKNIGGLNYRQLALLGHALRKPHSIFTVNSHQMSHRVAYATARSDLLSLVDRELLEKHIFRNSMQFISGAKLIKLVQNQSTPKD